MAEDTFEQPVEADAFNAAQADRLDSPAERTIQGESALTAVGNTTQLEPEVKAAGKKKPRLLIAIVAVLLVLAILAGGGFLGLRLYESQSLSQAKSELQQGNWAAAEASAEKALALQQTGLLANPLDLIKARAEARFQQKKYDLAVADFNTLKAGRPDDAAPYLYQAMILYDQGKLDEAVKTGQEALTRDNNLAFPFAIQAYQAYRQNKLADALNNASAAIERDDKLELAYRVRGSVLAWQYDFEAAQADLTRALELQPNQVETLAMQAYIHYMRYEEDALAASVDAAIEAGKDSAPGLWAQALLSLRNHDQEALGKLIDQAIKLDGTRPEYYFFRTLSYYKTEQEKQALADYDKALQLNPDFIPAIAEKAGYLFATYKKVDLEAEAQRVRALAPKASLPDLMLVDKYSRDLDWTKALEAVETAIKAQPGPVPGLLARAEIYMDQHEYDKAAADYQQMSEISAHDTKGLIGQARVQLQKRNFAEALKLLNDAAKIDPQSMEIHGIRALVYLANSDPTRARKEVEEGLKRDSGNVSLLVVRSMVSGQEDNTLSALSDINRVGELYPEDPSIMALRASILASNKDTKSALAELSKAENINKKLVDIYETRSMIYMAQGDPINAMSQAKKAIELDPKDAGAYGLLGEAEIMNDKAQDGIDHLKTSLELDPNQRYIYFALGMAQWNQGDVESGLANLNIMIKMKGKLAMQYVTGARDAVAFLDKVPKAVDGKRAFKDTMLEYSLTYPTNWVPLPPSMNGIGFQFMLTPVGDKSETLLQVQVIRYVDVDIHSKVSPELVSSVTMQQMGNFCYDFKKGAHEKFAGQGTQGVTDTFDCTYQTKDKQMVRVKQKVYIFTSDKSYVALEFTTTPDNFEKHIKAADEIAATFGFVK